MSTFPNVVIAPAMPEYADGPAGQIRAYIAGVDNVTAQASGDPQKVAAAIIASAHSTPAPRRLALGSDAYNAMRTALTSRLAELDAGKQTAASIDF
ncbi:hypothetical protein ACFRR7_06540 [Streptomyces sp. NPDC056909]|uniref:hypothetical protein n=1 Tax=Streptomyces sp. NPDC056909 TaxID=3345963 RepID=UPI003690EAE9